MSSSTVILYLYDYDCDLQWVCLYYSPYINGPQKVFDSKMLFSDCCDQTFCSRHKNSANHRSWSRQKTKLLLTAQFRHWFNAMKVCFIRFNFWSVRFYIMNWQKILKIVFDQKCIKLVSVFQTKSCYKS